MVSIQTTACVWIVALEVENDGWESCTPLERIDCSEYCVI